MKKSKLPLFLAVSSCCLASCSLSGLLSKGSKSSTSESSQIVKGIALYRGDTGELLHDGDNLEIETYYDFYLTLRYDGEEVKAKSIVSSDNSIVFPHSKSVYPRKEGNVTLTIKYQESSGNETVFTLNVKSTYHKDIESIYVGNAERGIKILENNQAEITGKVFAKYPNGVIRAINKGENLLTSVSNGKDSDHNKVTISFTENGNTKTVSYEVPLNNGNEIERIDLAQNFETYNKNGLYRNYPIAKSSGDLKVLIIPVWFSDSGNYFNETVRDLEGKTQKEQVIEDLENVFFGDPKRIDEQTVKSFYYDESFGKLNVSGKVSDWYETSYSSSTNYFRETSARTTLLKDAYDWYFSSSTESESDYDVVVLSYGSNHYGDASNAYTAFRFAINESGYPYLHNAVWLSALNIYNVDSGDTDYINLNDLSDNRNNDALFTITANHEFAHTMGAIDIYSDSRVNGVTSVPAGKLSMQAENRCGHDVFNMLGLGWASPYVLSADQDYGKNSITLTINDMQSSGDCVILSPSWNDKNSPFDEYLALELFAETGVNRFELVKNGRCGVRLYHVDARLYDTYRNVFTSDATNSDAILPFTNTAGVANGSSNYSVLSNYDDMDLLHMIRKETNDSKGQEIGYITSDAGRENMWFGENDTFNMTKYAKQFYNEGKLDDESDLGWSFKVNSITKDSNGGASASITFTKA